MTLSGQYAWQSLVTEERSWWWLAGAELKLRRGQASYRWEVFASIISWGTNVLGQNSDRGEVKGSYLPNPNLFLPGFGLGGGVGQPVQGWVQSTWSWTTRQVTRPVMGWGKVKTLNLETLNFKCKISTFNFLTTVSIHKTILLQPDVCTRFW